MQTFMPCDSYQASAKSLDYRRLGKQRVECKQILNVLTGVSKGWANHPAVKMWSGREWQLADYGFKICAEWRARGYRDTLLPWFADHLTTLQVTEQPTWMGNSDFHLSHKSNLIRKNQAFYSQQWPGIPDDLPYIWPNS